MANYFRITAYHPAKNICAVFDSNGRFESSGSSLPISFKRASKSSKSAGKESSLKGTSKRLLQADSSSYGLAERGCRSDTATASPYTESLTR